MPLSDAAIKNAKPTDKPYKMQDEKGMYLLVQPNTVNTFGTTTGVKKRPIFTSKLLKILPKQITIISIFDTYLFS